MKKRIFQLAKEFGMKSSDMVELLQRMGFDSVKGSQSTLPEDKEMQAIAQLQLYFEKRSQQSAPAEEAKPKKKLLPGAEPEPEEPEAAAATAAEPEHRELPKKQLPKSGPGLRKLPVKRPGDAEAHTVEAEAVEAAPHAHDTAAAAVAPAPAAPHVPHTPPPAPPPAPVEHHKPPVEVHTPPAEKPAAAAAAAPPPAAPPEEPPAPPAGPAKVDDDVKRLIVPQPKAKVLRRIELPAETIRDATRRSAPTSDRDLRRAALAKTQLRSASRTAQPANRRQPAGPGQSRGPGRDAGRGGPQKRGKSVPSTVDPNKIVEVEAPFSVKSISEALGVKVTDLIAKLTFKLGITGKNINSYLTQEEVELVALELDRKVLIVEHKEAEEEMFEQIGAAHGHQEELLRAPVVTFMGHVDHGKTSLLDALRSSDVARHEAGGITQHIGAYKVTNSAGHSIVILDTPGHAAFSAMRARGANLTDVVVLVVAADDGVKPQTEEAISHAKAANVPIVVAINKCDLPSANPMQVKQQLMIKGLQSEEWGGSTQMVEVSALKRTGLDDLVERIMLETEMMELKARPDAPGRGIVVESRQTPEQGVVVTVLVTDGTIRTKDQVVCGESFSRVRGLIDDHGRTVQEAGPSTPVTLLGLDRLPMPGDKLFIVEDAKKAREVVEERQRRARELNLAERSAVTLETLSAKLAEKDIQEIKLILKADVMGSLEPLRKCIAELTTPEVRVNLIHSALGGISETDVSLAAASGAVIVGFNMVADSSARAAAEKAGVEIRYYDVIYDLLDSLKAAMEGLLKPEEIESILGHAEVRAVFKSSKFGAIAGCYVTDGLVKRNAKVRLTRESRVIYTGKVASLRREKDDAKEVRAGFECGMTLQDYQDIKEGDILEFSQVELVKRTLA